MSKSLKLLTVLLVSCAYPLTALGQQWSTDFGPPPAGKGLNSSAQALLEYDGRLIVAGSFTQAGSLAVSRIAAWDGAQWSGLGGGIPDTGEDMTEYQGDLVVSGPSMLMRWDGSAWSTIPLPPGYQYPIFWSVCSYQGSLFVQSFENGVPKLAWWDGVSWASVPLPLDDPHTNADIQAMTVYGGQLFMTGTDQPWLNGGFLFAWNGEQFGGPGWVFPTSGLSLHVYHELLYVGGDWAFLGPPINDYGVAIWDQNSWIRFGPGPGGVWGMETYHGRIVMGGSGVTSFNGTTYNGENEQWLGGGCSSTMWVFAAKEFQGDLYVSGVFDEVCTEGGSVQSNYIAKWSEPVTAVSNARDVTETLRIETAPNPFNPAVTLSIHVPVKSDVTVTICDAAGRVVKRLDAGVQNAGPHHVTWNGLGDHGEMLASGVYFARATAGKATGTAKLVLLK